MPPPDSGYGKWVSTTLIGAVILAHLLILPVAEILLPTPRDIYYQYVWMDMIQERGLGQIYSWTDQEVSQRHGPIYNVNYPPLLLLAYSPGVGALAAWGLWPAWPSLWINLYFRLPIALGQLGLFAAVYRRAGSASGRFWTCLLVGLNPAFLLVGPVWGQLDVVLWGAMYCSLARQRQGEDLASGCWAALAALLKPQFLLFVPLLLCGWLRRPSATGLAKWALAFAVTVVLFTVPFLATSGLQCIRAGYSRVGQGAQDPVTTTAFNLWWVLSQTTGVTLADDPLGGVPCKYIGLLTMAVVSGSAGLLYCFGRRARPMAGLASIHLTICFWALTGLSERFLVYGLVPLCVWAVSDRRLRLPALVLSVLQILNLLHNAMWQPKSRFSSTWLAGSRETISMAVAIAVMVVLCWMVVDFITGRAGPERGGQLPRAPENHGEADNARG
jgi:uncharacterized membrane protein